MGTAASDPAVNGVLCAFAITAPLLLAWNVPPSSTFLNQALSIGGWGLFLAVMLNFRPLQVTQPSSRDPGLAAVSAGLGLIIAAAAVAGLSGGLPSSLAWSAIGVISVALITFWSAGSLAHLRGATAMMSPFCLALLLAGVLSAGVALVQVFEPAWADGAWIAATGLPGRAAGNLRQPNHLSSLTLWALVALAWLADSRRVPKAAAAVLGLLMVFSVVLTFSRTGTVGIVMLGIWGLVGRRLTGVVRASLASAPLWYAFGWWAATRDVAATASGAARFSAQGDVSSSRFAIWSETLELIGRHPWTGVGFGDFNFSWTLTPFPHRPTEFFDHTHNLLLQFAVELGLPLAALVSGLLTFALWRAFRAARQASERCDSVALQAAFMLVLLIAVHSLLEYPLWYVYFLLPTAFALGLGLGGGAVLRPDSAQANTDRSTTGRGKTRRWLQAGAVVMAAGSIYLVVDYWKVVVIFSPGAGAAPLSQRIDAGKRSLFFAHHAHYAAATTAARPSEAMDSFHVASHFLLDTRLMLAWAKAYQEIGDTERARHLADRMREFRNGSSADFFDACNKPASAGAAPPFQCEPAQTPMDERAFK